MKQWAKAYRHCENCKTTRRAHRAHGYCTRCSPLIRQLESTRKWNLNDPKSLKGYFSLTSTWRSDTLESVRASRITNLQAHLDYLKTREAQLAGKIDGLDLESAFNRIAQRCNRRNQSLFQGSSTFFDHNFTPKQKRILFRILNDIEEPYPYTGTSSGTAL